MKLYLKEPTLDDKMQILEMCKELAESDDEIKFEGIKLFQNVTEGNYLDFLDSLKQNKYIDKINHDYANQTTYVLTDEKNIVYGAVNLRHELKGNLRNIGGHIGYAIRPSQRHKGLATIQLKLILKKAAELNIEKVLVTCRDNYLASKKTMQKCIGKADSLVPSLVPGIMEYRYWIDVKKEINSLS